jgi:hypothetical protein
LGLCRKVKKISWFEELDINPGELEAAFLAWKSFIEAKKEIF